MTELRNVAHYVTDKISVSDLIMEEYISTDNMLPNRAGIVDCTSLPEAPRVTRYEPGDILVSNIRPYFKKIWYSDRTSGCSNDVLVFRTNTPKTHPKFIYYVLSQDAFFDHMMSGANGTKMPRGNKKTILDFVVPVFDIDDQIRIADILSAYDDLIENNQKQIKLLEEAAQRLYREWFVELRFPGHETTPVVDGVPEGWEYCSVGDFGNIITGKTPPTSDPQNYGNDVPFVTIPDMHGSIYPLFTERKLSTSGAELQRNKYVPAGSILVSCIATVGLVCIAPFDCQTNQQINTLVLHDQTNGFFMYFVMKNLKSLLDGLGSNGATMTNVNKQKFCSVTVLKPASALLQRFHNAVFPYFERILVCEKTISHLQEARDRLLPKLMSGEVEV